MKLNCSIADDLLPLYLEDVCSEGSKAALEEHLRECPACREKLARMKHAVAIPPAVKSDSEIEITGYAKKVKRHRLRAGIIAALLSVLSACMLSLCLLTIKDMRAQANPMVHNVEEGVCNLTAGDLETTAAEVGNYVFYTNSGQIKVSIPRDSGFDGQLLLWNAADKQAPSVMLYGNVNPRTNACTFTNLSSSQRYMVTCDGDADMAVTVSEGRAIGFWSSLANVLGELFSM